jgi:hypothetical protein
MLCLCRNHLEALMYEQKIQILNESQMEAEAREGVGEVTELGDVGETKGAFGSSGDGGGGLYNPM